MFSQCRGLTSISKKEDQENIHYVTGDKTHKETRINRKPVEMGVSRGTPSFAAIPQIATMFPNTAAIPRTKPLAFLSRATWESKE